MKWRPFSLETELLAELCQVHRIIVTDGEKAQAAAYECGQLVALVNGRTVDAPPVRRHYTEEQIDANPHVLMDDGIDGPLLVNFMPTHWMPESEILASIRPE
jgi:hypothetical protein